MTVAIVPRIPRRRRQSRMPLLLQLIWLRIRLRATLWRAEAGSLFMLVWLWTDLQITRALRRLLDQVLPPRK